MRAWLGEPIKAFLERKPEDTVGRLASAQQGRGFSGSAEQEGAWQDQVRALLKALTPWKQSPWTIALEFDLIRLEKRIDTVLLTDRAILVLEFKSKPAKPSTLEEAEDYALDLQDFHSGSRSHPIVPVLVGGSGKFQAPTNGDLLKSNPWKPLECGHDSIGDLIKWVQTQIPPSPSPLDGEVWLRAPYRPVPGIVEAATTLFRKNSVAEIAAARADTGNLTRTAEAISRAIEKARKDGSKVVILVTGIPGAGKTLCGLNAVFGHAKHDGSAFLTGNAPLVAVLREALARDAVNTARCSRKEADRNVKTELQNVHRFLEDHVLKPDVPPHERVIVFDEAQRAWDQKKAVQGSQNRPSHLTMSEPAHTLEIMGRSEGWCAVVALIGGGQEINTGEAGLAEWGRVIAVNPSWRAVAAPSVLAAADRTQRLANAQESWLDLDAGLDLIVQVRNVRQNVGAAWVNAVLEGDVVMARSISDSAGGIPYYLTRDLAEMRGALRKLARGERRAGIVRSSGAKRLRAEGLAAEVASDEVADWFLNSWPDVRASDALEAAATEYACQGLELDYVGVAWGGDFIHNKVDGWSARNFIGTDWTKATKEFHFFRNTYRVLLTRARYETVIWVPSGDPGDETRPPDEMNQIASVLLASGAKPFESLARIPAVFSV